MRLTMLLSGLAISMLCANPTPAQDLSGALKKIKETGAITLGHRESSVPFSYYDDKQQVVGYAMELCHRIVDAVKSELKLAKLEVNLNPVTSATRIPLIANGTVDLECGSTTNTLSRQSQVDFSLTTFVTGASLLALKETATANLSDLRIAVIPGTTTERVLKEALNKSSTTVTLIPVKDHADGRTALEQKTADAYASDREILIGLVLTAQKPGDFILVDRYFSYEPYALMLRRNDPDFRIAVDRSLARLYRSGEVITIYRRWLGSLGAPDALQLATWAIQGLPE